MPGFNRKGPRGEGPMTGRQMGKCTDFGAKREGFTEETSVENMNANEVGGMGRGLGLGRGRRGGGRGMSRGFGRACGSGLRSGVGFGRGMGRGFGRGTGQNQE